MFFIPNGLGFGINDLDESGRQLVCMEKEIPVFMTFRLCIWMKKEIE
jgi:hypothetical protein